MADLSSASLEMCLLDARAHVAHHVSLRGTRHVWTEKIAEIAGEVGRLDVLTIGSEHPEANLVSLRDSVGELRLLRDVVAWPLEQEAVASGNASDASAAGRLSRSIRALWKRGTSTVELVDDLGPNELPGEHRLAAITARLYRMRTLRKSAEVLLVSLWGGLLCVDRVSVAAGCERRASFCPLVTKRLRETDVAPNRWNPDLWTELLADPRIASVLEGGARYSVAIPTSANARLPLEWPGNCAGCDFGALEGMAALWLLKHGQW
jgi:hypothetical protein